MKITKVETIEIRLPENAGGTVDFAEWILHSVGLVGKIAGVAWQQE